jgi:hypothetical protein
MSTARGFVMLERFLREQYFAGYPDLVLRTSIQADGQVHITILGHDGTEAEFVVRLNTLVER